jgi:hypothetical protein
MSDKPVTERLQVKGGRRLATVAAPAELEQLLGGSELRAGLREADIVLVFVRDHASFKAQVTATLPSLRPGAILWVAYPKLTSKLAGDLNRDVLRAAAPKFGLDTVSQIALDDDWSALRLKRVP